MTFAKSWLILMGLALTSWPVLSRAGDLARLTPETGPYLVHAGGFFGPDAETKARALALELQKRQELPVFLYEEPKPKPGNPPRFAVLVGSFKTSLESVAARDRIKEIKPLRFESGFDQWRGVKRVSLTTNPLWPDPTGCTLGMSRTASPSPGRNFDGSGYGFLEAQGVSAAALDDSADHAKTRSTSCSAMSTSGP